MSETYTVTAKRWRDGWELHIAGEGVTQVRTLDKAEQTVRDYLETLHEGRDFTGARIVLSPDLDGLEDEVRAVRAEVAAAADAQRQAGARSRAVARALRDRGLSVTDLAAVMGVSRGRVSQLIANE